METDITITEQRLFQQKNETKRKNLKGQEKFVNTKKFLCEKSS